MATAEQRARRSAQRATAKAVKAARRPGAKYQPRVSQNIRQSVRQGQIAYAERVAAGKETDPPKKSAEGKELARVAAWASRGNAPAYLEAAFKHYWYHLKKDAESEADIEDSADYEDEEDEEELCS